MQPWPAGNSIGQCAVWCAQAFADVRQHPHQSGTLSGTQPNAKLEGAQPHEKKRLNFIGKFGAGEGIRTLDPNLGKVGPHLPWRFLRFDACASALETLAFPL